MTEPAKCVVCEREEGETLMGHPCKLIPIHTDSCIVPICSWPCMAVAATHAIIKCRICGSISTIPKWQVPGGMALGEHTFIIFVEDCKLHTGDLKCLAQSAIPL
jgi:hypothetical protein